MSLHSDSDETIIDLPFLTLSVIRSLFDPLEAKMSPRHFAELTVLTTLPLSGRSGGSSDLFRLTGSWTHFGILRSSRLLRENDDTVRFELMDPMGFLFAVVVSSTNITPFTRAFPTVAPHSSVTSSSEMSCPVALPQRLVLRTAPCFTIDGHENWLDVPCGVRMVIRDCLFI